MQWPSGTGAGFSVHGFQVQNRWVAPTSTQSFILLRLTKWVPGRPGNQVVKSKLFPLGGFCGLETVESHPQKGAVKFFWK